MNYKNNKVIKIENESNFILIDWVLGNYCNYKCSYCFPGSNLGNKRPPIITESIEKNILHLVNEIKKVSNKQIRFSLGGGEPTMYHDLTKLLKILNQYGTVLIITNGSRTLAWWANNFEYFHTVVVSFHIETNNYDHVLNLLKFLSNKIPNLILHVMIYAKMFDDCIIVYNKFIDALYGHNISIIPKVIREVDNSFVNFTPVHYQIIENLNVKRSSMPSKYTQKVSAHLETGEIIQIGIPDIKNLTGSVNSYTCIAHHSNIEINASGDIGDLFCGMQVYKKCNIFLDNFVKEFKIKIDEINCTRETCGCTNLILSTKYI
jgi:wyosine [tRNA(Phe)-imidazoG37] synthetase (radical SAM superfamily)